MGLVLRLFWYILGTLYINLYTVCFMYPNKFLLIVVVVVCHRKVTYVDWKIRMSLTHQTSIHQFKEK